LLLRTDLVSAIFNITLNLVVVPSFGMVGAATVTVATELLRLVVAQGHARTLGIRAPGPRRYAKALAATGVMAVVLATGIAPSPLIAMVVGVVVYTAALFAVRGLVLDTNGRPQLQV
jgi:O-antigen/teichoic acid export membrane protein